MTGRAAWRSRPSPATTRSTSRRARRPGKAPGEPPRRPGRADGAGRRDGYSSAHVARRRARAPDRRHAHGSRPPGRARDRRPQERAVRGLGRAARGRGDRPRSHCVVGRAGRGLRLDGRAPADGWHGHRSVPVRGGRRGVPGHGAGPGRAGGSGLGRRRRAWHPHPGHLSRPPGDERVRRRDARAARARPRRGGVEPRPGAHPPDAPGARHPAGADPLPVRRGRRRPRREQLPPPGGAGDGPVAAVRAGRVVAKPGRGPRGGVRGQRRGRSGWPCSATRNARSPRRGRSSGCSRSSWMRAGGRCWTAERRAPGARLRPGAAPPR